MMEDERRARPLHPRHTQDWFRGVPRAHARAGRGMDGDLAGKHARGRPDRVGQDALGVPVGDRQRVPRAHERDRSSREGRARTRILYILPLKALGVDVERNLRP